MKRQSLHQRPLIISNAFSQSAIVCVRSPDTKVPALKDRTLCNECIKSNFCQSNHISAVSPAVLKACPSGRVDMRLNSSCGNCVFQSSGYNIRCKCNLYHLIRDFCFPPVPRNCGTLSAVKQVKKKIKINWNLCLLTWVLRVGPASFLISPAGPLCPSDEDFVDYRGKLESIMEPSSVPTLRLSLPVLVFSRKPSDQRGVGCSPERILPDKNKS